MVFGPTLSPSDNITVNSVYANYIDLNTSYAGAMQEGRIAWNTDDGTLQVGMPGGNVNLQIGQEQLLLAKNVSGADMTNGQLVYISGGSGNRPEISLARADSAATADQTIGMLTEDIANNQQGYITTFGLVRSIDTSLYADGTALYLSATTAGAFIGSPPSKPNHQVRIGYVLRQHATEGIILFELNIVDSLSGLHDVSITSPAEGNVPKYNAVNTLWENGYVADSELTFTDITTNNATTSLHGFLPKLSGSSTQYLDGQGNWSVPDLSIEQDFVSQTSVIVNHNLGRMVRVDVADSSRNRIIPNNIQDAADYNSVTITFSSAESGRILVS